MKNAAHAIEPAGRIEIFISENLAKEEIFLDISDTDKGIPREHFETVFRPGFTTRKRGWGLGLSLNRPCVAYPQAHVYDKYSEIDKGTTFRIVLPSPSLDEHPSTR